MEIGRVPSIAPNAAATQASTASSSQAPSILPESQTVTPVVRAESPQLSFREVPLRLAERAPNDETKNQDIETAAERVAEESRQDRRDREVRRELEFDRDASALIFRSIDVESGNVVQQFPEEARLNLRAYLEDIAVDAERAEAVAEAIEEDIAAEAAEAG